MGAVSLAPILAAQQALPAGPKIPVWILYLDDHVSIEVAEIIDHHGQIVVRGRYDGDYDKTSLPDELILTNYFTVSKGKIDSLFVIRNTRV